MNLEPILKKSHISIFLFLKLFRLKDLKKPTNVKIPKDFLKRKKIMIPRKKIQISKKLLNI